MEKIIRGEPGHTAVAVDKRVDLNRCSDGKGHQLESRLFLFYIA